MFYTDENGVIKPYQYVEITDELLYDELLLKTKVDTVLRSSLIIPKKAKAKKEEKVQEEEIKKENKYFLFKLKDFVSARPIINDLLDTISKYDIPQNDLNFHVIYGENELYEEEPVFDEENLNALSRINNKILQSKLSEEGLSFPALETYSSSHGLINERSLNYFWNFDSVLNANNVLNGIAKDIKEANLSPVEKFLAAYSWVANYVYEFENSKKEYGGQSRKAVEILSSTRIVCVGYGRLLQQLCDRLNIPCTTQKVWYNDNTDSEFVGHLRNILKIKDDAFGINGVFVSDPTWDSKRKITAKFYEKSYTLSNVPMRLKFDTNIVPDLAPENILFDMLPLENEKLSEAIRSYVYHNGIKKYDKYAKFFDEPLKNYDEVLEKYNNNIKADGEFNLKFGVELHKVMEHNIEQIIKLHETINKTQAVELEVFQKALNNVFEKVNLGYFDFKTLKENNLTDIVEKITKYNYKMAQKRVAKFPALADQLTFTKHKDYEKYMTKDEMDENIGLRERL